MYFDDLKPNIFAHVRKIQFFPIKQTNYNGHYYLQFQNVKETCLQSAAIAITGCHHNPLLYQ